jgi:N-acetylglutamate synthase-like GNAT family acetyltransferase
MVGNYDDPEANVIALGDGATEKDKLDLRIRFYNPSGFLGSCLFKIHEEDHFIELIYFVVNPNCHKMGIGKMLMAKFKEYNNASKHNITRVVTFADNSATEFFKKSGFFKLNQQ